MTKENILRINDATMQFGGVVAVNNLNLEVNKGEIIGLIGPNGAGKTTVFNVITGVYAPTNGAVDFAGRRIIENHPHGKMKALYKGENDGVYKEKTELTPDKITRLGMARTFQNIRLFKALTVFENVLIAMHMRSKANIFSATFRLNHKEEAEMRRETMELLKIFGLEKNKDDVASSLPYGKQRHLEIARALATEPKLLLLDEPAAGMNPNETVELMNTIRFVRDNFDMTVLLIEHDMTLVSGICEKLSVLNFGQLLCQGNTSDVLNNPEVITAYLGE